MGKGMPYIEVAVATLFALIVILRAYVGHDAFMSFIFGEGAKTKKSRFENRLREESKNIIHKQEEI